MKNAVIVSLEDIRSKKKQEEMRKRLHEHLDEALNHIEESIEESKPSLMEITGEVFKARQEITKSIVENLVDIRYMEEKTRAWMLCPCGCKRRLTSRGVVERTVETVVGMIKISRPYFYCEKSNTGFYPMDETLGLTERRKQLDVQKAIAGLAKEMPYGSACELYGSLTGLKVSEHCAHEITNEVAEGLGVLEVSPSREEVERSIEAAGRKKGRKWRPIMVVGIDGADAPTRSEEEEPQREGKRPRWKGQWREAKGFRVYLVDGDRIDHVVSWHQIQSEEELFASLEKVKAAGLIPEEMVRLCVVADGAPWIWTRVHELFPTAKEVLDYYHAAEHVHGIAEVQYKHDPYRALEWVEATITRLFMNDMEGVVSSLRGMIPSSEEAASVIERGIGYLQKNKERMKYKTIRKGGYPLGSGGIESAHKFISHVRLKRSGAWWYVSNGNNMLALRCAKYNDTFDRLFDRRQQKLKEKVSKN